MRQAEDIWQLSGRLDALVSAVAAWADFMGIRFVETLNAEGLCVSITMSCNDGTLLYQRLMANGNWCTEKSTKAVGFDWPYGADRPMAWNSVARKAFRSGEMLRYVVRRIVKDVSIPGYSLEKMVETPFPRFEFSSLEEFALKLSTLYGGNGR